MTLITHVQNAPEDSTYALTAFDAALGTSVPLKMKGEVVGEATLVGAIPSRDRRSMTLTWEVDEIFGQDHIAAAMSGSIAIDDFTPSDAFNPAAAIAKAKRVGLLGES